jgi:hypothetical protein
MIAMIALVAAAPVATVPSQIEAGALATWSDLSTWSRPSATAGQIETGLGLVVTGPNGDMRLAFYVERPAQGRQALPRDIGVRAAAGAVMSPNLLRTPTLTFTSVGADDKKQIIDVSSRMAVDNPAPGAAVTSGVARMSVADFRALASSVELQAKVFGAEVALRDDQIEAIRAFRDRVLPPVR